VVYAIGCQIRLRFEKGAGHGLLDESEVAMKNGEEMQL